MPPKFGTSGLRGLVTELTPEVVSRYVHAFVSACPTGSGVWVARDLRPSSPEIASVVVRSLQEAGVRSVDAGCVPTPALALAAMEDGAAAIMVTGSHIPADRNGLKFYRPDGEITKGDEQSILRLLEAGPRQTGLAYAGCSDDSAGKRWVDRYLAAFGSDALHGMRLGVWTHSAVSRDLLVAAFTGLGATVLELGRSDQFIAVDTEAVPDAARGLLCDWSMQHDLDAIVSTDGDGDRPLLTDARGRVVMGDVLGQITARVLGADTVVTPVNANTGAEAGGAFGRVIRTRIGSPQVIAAMSEAGGRVVGYEANGGFLLGFDADGPSGSLPALSTRDSLLPLVSVLSTARKMGGVAALVAAEPQRFTAMDRIENVPVERSAPVMSAFQENAEMVDAFLSSLGECALATDRTDGIRITLASGRILHFRASGNAPEFRIYAEAETESEAWDLLSAAKQAIGRRISQD